MKGLESLLLFVSPVQGFTLSICTGDPLSWGLQVRENKAFKVVKGTRTDGDSSNGAPVLCCQLSVNIDVKIQLHNFCLLDLPKSCKRRLSNLFTLYAISWSPRITQMLQELKETAKCTVSIEVDSLYFGEFSSLPVVSLRQKVKGNLTIETNT